MNTWQWALALILFLLEFWGLYLAAMVLLKYYEDNDGNIPFVVKLFGYPLVAIGGLVDVFANLTIACVIFLDIPREFLVTSRLERYHDRKDWRGKLARSIAHNLLDPFDPDGVHVDGEGHE